MESTGRGKLLLVEDEALLRRLIAEFLRGEGFEIVEAANGLEGVERFSDKGPYDLVLLDLNLPMLSGVEVCRKIKEQQPLQPVLICSGAILDNHVAALHELRVAHFLSKPYHPLVLLEHIAFEMYQGPTSQPESIHSHSFEPNRHLEPSSRPIAHRTYPGQASAVGLR